jgi:cytochrome c biogenesis protein CcdA
MVETVTPAVCGSRKRQLAALVFFAAGATAAASGIGALLGLAGAAVGRGPALAFALVLAVLGAMREAGLLRFRIPQSKRQVPERWRSELPLPVWATGYGAGLGLGVLTYQPVATVWVACAAVLALGRPLAGAVAFALYGVGRTLVLLLPARRDADPVAIVERLAGRRRTLLRANVVALAVCACLLAAAPVAGAGLSRLDPSMARSGFAFTLRTDGVNRVVVRPADETPAVFFDGAELPSLNGERLAYADSEGIRVVRWRSNQEVARFRGPLSKPALEWPWLVFRRQYPSGASALVLRNLVEETRRRIGTAPAAGNIGRPSIAGDRVAWHFSSENGSKIVIYRVSDGTKGILFRSRIALFSNPALTGRHVLWLRQVQGRSAVFVRRLSGGPVTRLGAITSQSLLYWTTDLYQRTAFVTRWRIGRETARILRITF